MVEHSDKSPLSRSCTATTGTSFAARLIRLVGRAASVGLGVDDMAEEAMGSGHARLRSPRDEEQDDGVEVLQDFIACEPESSAANADDEGTSSSKAASAENSSETPNSSTIASSEVDSDSAETNPLATLEQLRDDVESEVRVAAGLVLSITVEEEIVVEEQVLEVDRADLQSHVSGDRDDVQSADGESESVEERQALSTPHSPWSPPSSASNESPTDFSFEMGTPPSEPDTVGEGPVDSEMLGVAERSGSARGAVQTSPQVAGNDVEQLRASGSAADGDESGKMQSSPAVDNATEAKKISVCEHCGREFEDELSEMATHESECEVLKAKKALQESQASSGSDTHDNVSAPAPNDDAEPPAELDDSAIPTTESSDSKPLGQIEVDDHTNEDIVMHDNSVSDTPGGDTVDDDEDDDSRPPVAPIVDKEQGVQEQQPQQPTDVERDDCARTSDNDGYRVLRDAGSSKIAKAECLYCGKILGYRKGNVRRHVSSCPSNPINSTSNVLHNSTSDPIVPADKEPSTPPASPPPALKKAPKRKYVLTEADLADAPEQSVANLTLPKGKAPEGDLQLAISLQTPRRSKRIKRDPSQSPKRTADTRAPPTSPSLSNPVVPTADGDSDVDADHTMDVDDDDDDTSAVNPAVAMKLRDDESTDSETPQTVVFRCMGVNDLRRMDHAAAVAWLFGSSENAAKMKLRYRDSVLAVHGLYARFHPFILESLGDLETRKLVEATPPSTTFTLFVDSVSRSSTDHRAASVSITSKHEALALYNLGFSLTLPAPAVIADLIIPLLARDLQVSALVNAAAHEAKIVCCQAGSTFSWQFYRDDCFVVNLKGNARWKTKQGPVRFPVQDYRPRLSAPTSLAHQLEEEAHAKVHCMSAGTKSPSFLLPPTEDYHMVDSDGDDAASAVCEATLAPGSVMYVPGGTWFVAEVVEDAAWLEIRLASMSPTELVIDALRQLCSTDEQWRQPLLQSQDAKATRTALGRLLKNLGAKIASLSPFDLLPEEVLLLDNDAAPASSSGTDIVEAADADVTIDLSRHRFRGGKHIKIFKTMGFRENHLAFLTTLHELPSVLASRQLTTATTAAPVVGTTPSRDDHVGASKKRALKKKPKKSAARATQQRKPLAENVYVLHVNFGSANFHSKVRVQFQCDAFQAAIVEWIRKQDGAPFHASDALKFVKSQHKLTKPHDEDEGTKYVLRFLCTVGYITPTKVPSE